jgi:hypothetical protein
MKLYLFLNNLSCESIHLIEIVLMMRIVWVEVQKKQSVNGMLKMIL